MEIGEALAAVQDADDRDHSERARRLVELSEMVGSSDAVFFSQAAEWLFDDVKATGIYGYFSATVVTAYAYCTSHLAGLLLLGRDERDLPDAVDSLEGLAAACTRGGLIDVDLQAMLSELQLSADAYLPTTLSTAPRVLEQRLGEASLLSSNEHPLQAEARAALSCCTSLIFSR